MLTQKIFLVAQSGAEAILWLLIILSVVSVAMMLERFLALRKIKTASLRVGDRIREALQSNHLSEIEEIARDRNSFEGKAVAYGLRHIKDNGEQGLEEIFNTYALLERPHLDRYLGFLATVGSNAPFIGLLGTVLGIMKAFNDLGVSQGEISTVMVGIAEALVATAVGLMVAIPAVIAYNYFQRQMKNILQSLESAKELCLAYVKQRSLLTAQPPKS